MKVLKGREAKVEEETRMVNWEKRRKMKGCSEALLV